MENCQGKALVASPYLSDSNFMRTVIYILQHDQNGALGLVLNRPLNLTVGQLMAELMETQVDNDQPVFYGGPVEGLVVIVQASVGTLSEQRVVMLPRAQDQITELAKQNSSDCKMRIFDGYSGWGPSQLESELKEGSWLVWEASPSQLMGDPDGLWQTAVRQIGREVIAQSVVGIDLPQDPSNN